MTGYAVVRYTPTQFKFTMLHESFAEAQQECERLCIKTSDIYMVMKVVGRFQPQKPPAEWVPND